MTINTDPFFIIGVHRSGTTLLRFMLCSHSRIYIPPESDFIPYFFGQQPHTELSDEQISKILQLIFTRYRFVGEWRGSPLKTEEILSKMTGRTPANFLNALYSIYANQNGKARWGDKTPIYASYVKVIHSIFPRAKFIHIVRDPYDAGLSLLDKYEKEEFHIDIYYAAQNWVRRINDIETARLEFPPDLYYELCYEDLVQKPEEKLRQICTFLGEPYEHTMLDHHVLARNKITPDSYFFSNVRNPINSDSVGKGRRELSLRDRRIIHKICGQLMVKYGYVPERAGEMKLPEQIRFSLLKMKYVLLQSGRRTMTNLRLMPPI